MFTLPTPLTPYLTLLKGLVIGFAAALVFSCGFWVGSRGKAAAEAALLHVQQIAQVEKKDLDAKVKDLSAFNESLSGVLALEKQESARLAAEREREWAKQTQAKDATIAKLKANSKASTETLNKLMALRAAETDPLKMKALDLQIAALNGDIQSSNAQVQGLECLTVPIPGEYLNLVNGDGE